MAQLKPDDESILIFSVALWLQNKGFSKVLKRFCVAAQIEGEDWKANALNLNEIFSKYLEISSSAYNDFKFQEKQEEKTANGATAEEITGKKKKKKKSKDDTLVNKSEKTLEDTALIEKINESYENINEDESHKASKKSNGDKMPELAEDQSTKKPKEKKKKSKVASRSMDADVTPEGTEHKQEVLSSKKAEAAENGIDESKKASNCDKMPELAEDQSTKKPKEKKKKSKVASRSLDADVTPEVTEHKQKVLSSKKAEAAENGIDESKKASNGDKMPELAEDQSTKKPKEKKKKSKLASRLLDADVTPEVTEHKEEVLSSKKAEAAENGIDESKKASKKRKRMAADENENESGKEVAIEESKSKKSKCLEEGKDVPPHTAFPKANGHALEQAKSDDATNNNEMDIPSQKKSASKQPKSYEPTTVNAFQRAKIDEVEFVDDRLQDNSYWAKMSWQRLIIRHGGHWDIAEYIGGDEVLVYMAVEQISLANLLREIHEQVGNNCGSDYMLFYTTNASDGRRIKVSLKTDTDLFRLIVEQKDDPVIYVIKKCKQSVDTVHAETPVLYDSQRSTVLPDFSARCTSSSVHEDEPMSSGEEKDELVYSDDEEDANQQRDIFDSLTNEFGVWIRQSRHFDNANGQRNFTSEHLHDDEARARGDDTMHKLRNWVISLLDCDSVLPLDWIESSRAQTDQLCIDSTFKTKDELTIAVGLYHLENHVEYVVDRSSKMHLGYVCKHGNGCPFTLQAIQRATIWRVIKLNKNHTCHLDLNRTVPQQVSAKIVGKYFARKLVDKGVVLKPREMIEEMHRQFGIEMVYSFALRARNIAIEIIYGDFEWSYQLLPSYLHLLRESNPGTLYDIETTHDGEFRYLFLALGQSLHAFKHYLRPVIVVDVTHLKGKNKGICFVAVTNDGNEGVFPLAIGLGPVENEESWTWFLSQLRSCIDQPDDLLVVSDQHKGIEKAMESVYPNVAHVLCFYHLQKNMARFGSHIGTVIKSAAYSYRLEEFERYFSKVGVLKPAAHRHLLSIGEHKWSRLKCPVRRYSFMTSNAAKSLNNRLSWARRLPICLLLETFRSITENLFDARRASAVARSHELTEVVSSKLNASVEKGRHLVVRSTTTHMFKVEEENTSYVVDLQNWTCECREFDLDEIPCRHACAAIRCAGLKVTDFVAQYYKQSIFSTIYSCRIASVPHPGTWIVPDSISAYIVRPPIITRQAERPKLSMMQSVVEGLSRSLRQICSRCKGQGHNRRSCTTPIAIGDEPSVERTRRKKKCSICQNEAHIRNECPMHVSE